MQTQAQAQFTGAERKASLNPYGVKVGQIWESNNPRASKTAKRTVQRVEGAYAFCLGRLGQSVRIRLDRFNSKIKKGYTLIQDA